MAIKKFCDICGNEIFRDPVNDGMLQLVQVGGRKISIQIIVRAADEQMHLCEDDLQMAVNRAFNDYYYEHHPLSRTIGGSNA